MCMIHLYIIKYVVKLILQYYKIFSCLEYQSVF